MGLMNRISKAIQSQEIESADRTPVSGVASLLKRAEHLRHGATESLELHPAEQPPTDQAPMASAATIAVVDEPPSIDPEPTDQPIVLSDEKKKRLMPSYQAMSLT